jgi:hypothetical protein
MKRELAIAVCGAVLVMGACSGSDARLSKEEFLKQGNAICAAGGKSIDDAFSKGFPEKTAEPDAATITKFFKETFAPLAKKLVDDLDALKPPQELQAPIDTAIAHFRTTVANVVKQAETDPLAIFAFENDPFADVNNEAGAIGLTECNNSNNNS